MKLKLGFCSATLSLLALLWLPGERLLQAAIAEESQPHEELGRYFSKKRHVPAPLPRYEELQGQLPSPIYDDNPLWVETYWKAWQLAFRNFYEPAPQTGFVSQFIDAAFNQNIFLWDSCFMTMFCNYGSPLVPGIATLDNFYAKQHEDGEICREIDRSTGIDFSPWMNRENQSLFSRWGWVRDLETGDAPPFTPALYRGRKAPSPNPKLSLDAMNHPILAWAELESFRVTGNTARLQMVWEPLVRYFQSFKEFVRQGNGLYMSDWASMDNSPRNRYLNQGGTAIDTSAEMALFARHLSQMAGILGKEKEASQFAQEASALSEIINRRMWDKKRKFYFDLTLGGKHAPVKTIAAYWTLIARVASPSQTAALVAELENPRTFGRTNLVPTLAADEPEYDPSGGYWRGAVWPPTTTMVIRGLEAQGYNDLARKIALQHLSLVAETYRKTGTIWENYSPDAAQQGKPAKGDFVGWSGMGPIMFLLEYAIGLRPDASRNELLWELTSGGRRGCDRFRFNGHVVSLLAEPRAGNPAQRRIRIESDGDFTLRVAFKGLEKQFPVARGVQEFTVGE